MAEDRLITRRPGRPPVVIERLSPKPRLIVLGGGHIAQALVPMAADLELSPVVYDDRPFFANRARFPQAAEVICQEFGDLAERVQILPSDLVVIATRGHKHDEACLAQLLGGPEPFYLGMIGSRRRVAIVRQRLAKSGIDPGRLDRVR